MSDLRQVPAVSHHTVPGVASTYLHDSACTVSRFLESQGLKEVLICALHHERWAPDQRLVWPGLAVEREVARDLLGELHCRHLADKTPHHRRIFLHRRAPFACVNTRPESPRHRLTVDHVEIEVQSVAAAAVCALGGCATAGAPWAAGLVRHPEVGPA